MRIVLDTSILVRANEHSLGIARELLVRITNSAHRLVISNEMLYELTRVLRYPRLQTFYQLSESVLYDYVAFLRHTSEIVILNPLVIAPIRDVNDVIVMQTAIIGQVDVLCTRDEDFFEKPACEYLNKVGIKVMDEIALMKMLRP
ncbi:MAG: putative toxin-antitoxin system toxin component, PIN family [Candidatus Angelobacter sp. Gp1-AA117]|nr:MAG: putative toxin-antitoxin system toxin component, PIN family [Candidatus Angelobacter sp. Gp1-AA117]